MEVNNNVKDSIRIRRLTMEDFNFVLNWSKDEAFCSANGWEKNRNPDELYKWWQRCVFNRADNFIRMGIEFEEKLIGYADLAYIKDYTAEIGIAIGESALWGKGIGFHSAICMMDYASKMLGISTINAETHETNIRSRKMLERIGFKEISRIGSEEYLGAESQLIQYRLSL